MITQKNMDIVFSTLPQRYPDNETELIYETPFQLLLSVILSAQTTDKQVNKVTSHFYDHVRTPADVLTYDLESWTQLLSSVNFYKNKAKNSYKTAQLLTDTEYQQKYLSDRTHDQYETHGYIIPDSESALTILPWVGVKTAKVILHCLYDMPVIAVDTHVHRVANRLWIVKTTTPLETAKIIEQRIPARYLSVAHHGLIMFGRYHCKARWPLCDTCPFASFCTYPKK